MGPDAAEIGEELAIEPVAGGLETEAGVAPGDPALMRADKLAGIAEKARVEDPADMRAVSDGVEVAVEVAGRELLQERWKAGGLAASGLAAIAWTVFSTCCGRRRSGTGATKARF